MKVYNYYDVHFAGTDYVPATNFTVALIEEGLDYDDFIEEIMNDPYQDEEDKEWAVSHMNKESYIYDKDYLEDGGLFYFVKPDGEIDSPVFYDDDEEALYDNGDFLIDLAHAMEDCLSVYDYDMDIDKYHEECYVPIYFWPMALSDYGAHDFYLSQCGISSLDNLTADELWETGINNTENWSMNATKIVVVEDNGTEIVLSPEQQ